VDKFTTEQLLDARNRLRTTLSQVETNESFDAVHTSETYQKNKLFLELLNTAIAEREAIEEKKKQSPAQKAAFKKMMDGKKGKGKSKDKKAGKGKKPDFLDLDKDGNTKEPMDGAAKDAKNEGMKIVARPDSKGNLVGRGMATVDEPKGAGAVKSKGAQAAVGKDGGAAQPKGKGIGAAIQKKLNASKNKTKESAVHEGKYEYFDDKESAQKHAEKHGGKVYTNSGKGNAGGKNTHVVIKEGAEEQATLVMAAKDMVDRITGWMEDTAEMQTESMLELGDKIRDEMGIDQSETFINTVKPALGSLFTSLESTRDSLTSGVAILTGEGAPDTMGDEVPADDDMDMEPTVDADMEADAPEGDDEFAAADASAGGDEADDRGKRESIQLSKRLGLLLADSKKKD
jgi:hypothetical protein